MINFPFLYLIFPLSRIFTKPATGIIAFFLSKNFAIFFIRVSSGLLWYPRLLAIFLGFQISITKCSSRFTGETAIYMNIFRCLNFTAGSIRLISLFYLITSKKQIIKFLFQKVISRLVVNRCK